MPSMIALQASSAALSFEASRTSPESSSLISITQPVRASSSRIVLPPGPISMPILSDGIMMRTMRGARGGDGFLHLVEDEQAAFLGLGERLLRDRHRNPGGLQVHLERRDALLGPG